LNSYGECGKDLIFSTIQKLYASDGTTSSLWGFPFLKFIERVLIPETAILLIQDDFGLDMDLDSDRVLALELKDDSTLYGNMQYPYEDEEEINRLATA